MQGSERNTTSIDLFDLNSVHTMTGSGKNKMYILIQQVYKTFKKKKKNQCSTVTKRCKQRNTSDKMYQDKRP